MDGIWDIHCHLVPNVDDGSGSLDLSMAILEKEYAEGVRGVIVTPHFRVGMFETDGDAVEQEFLCLQKAAEEALPDLTLLLGCEFHANYDMPETVGTDARYRMNGSCYVLVEFSEGDPARYIVDLCQKMRSAGYIPIVAHAERYDAIVKTPSLIDDLHDFGAYIQINADSILGEEGWGMKRFCAKLIREDQIDFIGSDVHDLKKRPSRIGQCAEFLQKKYGSAYVRDRMIRNPVCVARGEVL